jgi:hypothetical protein
MGIVTCGLHGCRCCWGCDRCPRCDGGAFRLGRGDYCPDCVKKLKAAGYVWSEFYKDYKTPDEIRRTEEYLAKKSGQSILKF